MITTKLLKYIFRGMIKGVEDYEKDTEKEHIDETGRLAQVIKEKEDPPGKMRAALITPEKKMSPPPEKKSDPSNKIDLDDILKDIG